MSFTVLIQVADHRPGRLGGKADLTLCPVGRMLWKEISLLLSTGASLGRQKKLGSQMMSQTPPSLTQRLSQYSWSYVVHGGVTRERKTWVLQANWRRIPEKSDGSIEFLPFSRGPQVSVLEGG